MDTDLVVRNFRVFMVDSWPIAEKFFKEKRDALEFQEALDDFFQANWEILVEQLLCPQPHQFLEVYGNGADCNGSSSRVWLPDSPVTHRVVCKPKNEGTVKDAISETLIVPNEYQFDGFIFWENGKYGVAPPFDHVLLTSFLDNFVVNLNEIHFVLEEVSEKE